MAFEIGNYKTNASVLAGLNPNAGSTETAPTGHVVVGTATATSTSIVQSQRWLFGDYTSTEEVPHASQVRTGGIGDFGKASQYYRALVNIKSLTAQGSATSTSAYGLVVSLVAATSTGSLVANAVNNAYIIDSKFVPMTSGTSTGNVFTALLQGGVPVSGGAQYACLMFTRVNAAGQTSPSSTALDAVIEAIG